MLKTIKIRRIFCEKPQNKWVRKGVINDMNAHFYVLLSDSTCSVIVVKCRSVISQHLLSFQINLIKIISLSSSPLPISCRGVGVLRKPYYWSHVCVTL